MGKKYYLSVIIKKSLQKIKRI